jgi:hypothetical protein
LEHENILNAYHESARVVFAYLNGYSCDLMELPGKNSGSGSKLNAGSDVTFVQAVLSGNPLSLPAENLQHAIEVARKLMALYCAGTCAKIYFQNNLKIPDELEIDISGQDLAMIEKIQSFLKKAIVDHPDDYPSKTIVAVFRKLKDPEVWKAIELLAAKVLEHEDNTLKRFYIEDTLMMAGIRIQKAATRSGFNLGVHEDDSPKPAPQQAKSTVAFKQSDLSPLDIMVKDFLKNIKSNWQEEELDSAITYLHGVYKKYGE